jgi:hypothetical protein
LVKTAVLSSLTIPERRMEWWCHGSHNIFNIQEYLLKMHTPKGKYMVLNLA